MDSIVLANAFRDWMVYRNTNMHYKLKVSRVINLWPDERKSLLKPYVKHLSAQSTTKAWLDITDIYRSLVPLQTEAITTADGTYTNWVLLKSSALCNVYTATLITDTEETVIVKMYLNVERCMYAIDEDLIGKALYESGFNVPKRYNSFHTYHHLCIPMHKLDTVLSNLYQLNPVGIGLQCVKQILSVFIPILSTLHKDHKCCYVDFSCANVAFHNNQPYMIDFGALHRIYMSTPCQKTLRYASIHADEESKVTYTDDLQSLGFLLTEALYGPYYPLNKSEVITNALEGKLGVFLQAYFKALESDDPYTTLMALC